MPFLIPILVIPTNCRAALCHTLFQPNCVNDLWARFTSFIPCGGEGMIFTGMDGIFQAEFDWVEAHFAGDVFNMAVERPVSLWYAVPTESTGRRRVGIYNV